MRHTQAAQYPWLVFVRYLCSLDGENGKRDEITAEFWLPFHVGSNRPHNDPVINYRRTALLPFHRVSYSLPREAVHPP